jgi:hypothetical protein
MESQNNKYFKHSITYRIGDNIGQSVKCLKKAETICVAFLSGAGILSFRHLVNIKSGVHAASYPIYENIPFLGEKAAGA